MSIIFIYSYFLSNSTNPILYLCIISTNFFPSRKRLFKAKFEQKMVLQCPARKWSDCNWSCSIGGRPACQSCAVQCKYVCYFRPPSLHFVAKLQKLMHWLMGETWCWYPSKRYRCRSWGHQCWPAWQPATVKFLLQLQQKAGVNCWPYRRTNPGSK